MFINIYQTTLFGFCQQLDISPTLLSPHYSSESPPSPLLTPAPKNSQLFYLGTPLLPPVPLDLMDMYTWLMKLHLCAAPFVFYKLAPYVYEIAPIVASNKEDTYFINHLCIYNFAFHFMFHTSYFFFNYIHTHVIILLKAHYILFMHKLFHYNHVLHA